MRKKEQDILDKIIGDGSKGNRSVYDKRIRPSGKSEAEGEDGPVIVSINVFVRSISKISDLDMEFACQLTFRQEWTDSRLAFEEDAKIARVQSLTLTDQDRIWKPDAFFRNEKDGHPHNIIMPNVLLRIKPDGHILYSIRLSLLLSCPMDLTFYPLDTQRCSINVASCKLNHDF